MNDPVDRQDAIDEQVDEGYYCAEHDVGYGEKWQLTFTDRRGDFAINKLSVLPSAQRWIPVSERLPDNTRTVLTTFVESGVVKVDTLHYFREPLGWTDFRYNEELGRPKSYEVTAWMELPEPWRDE